MRGSGGTDPRGDDFFESDETDADLPRKPIVRDGSSDEDYSVHDDHDANDSLMNEHSTQSNHPHKKPRDDPNDLNAGRKLSKSEFRKLKQQSVDQLTAEKTHKRHSPDEFKPRIEKQTIEVERRLIDLGYQSDAAHELAVSTSTELRTLDAQLQKAVSLATSLRIMPRPLAAAVKVTEPAAPAKKGKAAGPKPLNEAIEAPLVNAVDDKGAKLGQLTRDAMLALAQERDMSFVQVTPVGKSPVIVRLMTHETARRIAGVDDADTAAPVEELKKMQIFMIRTSCEPNDLAHICAKSEKLLARNHPITIQRRSKKNASAEAEGEGLDGFNQAH